DHRGPAGCPGRAYARQHVIARRGYVGRRRPASRVSLAAGKAPVKILMVGAAGDLGRSVISHLAGHEIIGTTRDRARLPMMRDLGATGVLCDVYQPEALDRVAQ